MLYAVTSNMPGYMPESEGYACHSYNDARVYLLDELERWVDDCNLANHHDGMTQDEIDECDCPTCSLGYYVDAATAEMEDGEDWGAIFTYDEGQELAWSLDVWPEGDGIVCSEAVEYGSCDNGCEVED